MVNQKNISSLIAIITPGILTLLMEKHAVSLEEASRILYNSELYSVLEQEHLKLWRLSYPILYDMLEEELETGKITYPEEQ
ncbi:MAG: hypothetical protein LBU51_06500 [Bacteroidales bacterium]|jgi:hypothetical protein|nr:hypothetical protein [Bacteroidales bacterium]